MATEKRLKDANALMDEFRRYMAERYDRVKCISEENCKTCSKGCLWRNVVSKAPAVDAVEVVRCKDCKWRQQDDVNRNFCGLGDFYCGDTDFCSRGERKDNAP